MVCIGHVNILSLGHALKDLLHKKYLVVNFDSLESAYELLITLPGTELSKTLKIKQPLVVITQNLRNKISQGWVGAIDPLSWIDSLGDVLESVRNEIVKFTVDDTFGSIVLLQGNIKNVLAADVA